MGVMLAKRPWLLGVGGALSGVALGLGYWFVWGCRRCAQDNSPVSVVAFFAVVCAAMAHFWGKDHLRPPT